MHPLYGALPMPHVPMRVTRGALVTWSHIGICTYATPLCRTSQHRSTFIPLSVSLWNDLAYNVFDGVGLAGFKSRVNGFFIGLSCSIPFVVNYFFHYLLSVYMLVLWGYGLWTDRV